MYKENNKEGGIFKIANREKNCEAKGVNKMRLKIDRYYVFVGLDGECERVGSEDGYGTKEEAIEDNRVYLGQSVCRVMRLTEEEA